MFSGSRFDQPLQVSSLLMQSRFLLVVSETPACLSEMSQLLSESCIVSSLGEFCWYNEKRQFLLLLPLLCDRTIGTLYVTFFITVTASLTIPFRCETHPSGLRTLQAERNVENTIGDEGLHRSTEVSHFGY